MKLLIAVLATAPLASAFPALLMEGLARRAPGPSTTLAGMKRVDTPAVAESKAETNCGPRGPCLTFDPKDQYVSNKGAYAYQNPSVSDIRGPCPGLNAAANHGYLPRNGIASITETILGLGQLYAMGPDLAGFLAAYAIAMDGDPVNMKWSIGGPMPGVTVLPTGYAPQGISYSHNKYEGDTSLTRPDAYLNNGDAHSLSVDRFRDAYSIRGTEDRITADKFRLQNRKLQQDSISKNPYYFAPLFSTTLVTPAAYNFIINFMSNHSAAEPSGYLNGEIFKQFFAVSGSTPDKFVWKKGQERIPDNWYRRPTLNPYGNADVFLDLIRGWAAYPDTLRFGGNVDGVNSYEGVDIGALTGGTYTNDNILEGDNFACLVFQTQQQAFPDVLKGIWADITAALEVYHKYADPLLAQFNCSQLAKYDAGNLNKYPGRTYNPQGPDNSY